MTLQEFFNDTYRAFVIDKAPMSFNHNLEAPDMQYGCLYRGPNGEKCAIGRKILDEKYNPGMEQSIASLTLSKYHGAAPELDGISGMYLDAIQRCHDDAALKADEHADFHTRIWRNLVNFAAAYELSVPA